MYKRRPSIGPTGTRNTEDPRWESHSLRLSLPSLQAYKPVPLSFITWTKLLLTNVCIPFILFSDLANHFVPFPWQWSLLFCHKCSRRKWTVSENRAKNANCFWISGVQSLMVSLSFDDRSDLNWMNENSLFLFTIVIKY